jgi:hypothetical protein
MLGNLVRPVHRKRRLAYPRGPADDRNYGGSIFADLVQRIVQCLQFAGPPDKMADRGGKLPRDQGQAPTLQAGRPAPAGGTHKLIMLRALQA